MATIAAVKMLGFKVLNSSQTCAKHTARSIFRRGFHMISLTQNLERQKVAAQSADMLRNGPTGVQLNQACRLKSHYEHRSSLEYEDMVALIESGDIYLIDVRDVKDVKEQGAFPDALNIPLPELKKSLQMSNEEFLAKYGRAKPQPTDTNIVFASLKAVKSSAALEIAHKMGYDKSRQYENGYEEWIERSMLKRSST